MAWWCCGASFVAYCVCLVGGCWLVVRYGLVTAVMLVGLVIAFVIWIYSVVSLGWVRLLQFWVVWFVVACSVCVVCVVLLLVVLWWFVRLIVLLDIGCYLR